MSTVILMPVTSTVDDAAGAATSLIIERLPALTVAHLGSIGAPPSPAHVMRFDVEDTIETFEPRCLVDDDQIAMALPNVVRELLDHFERVVWCGGGVLPTGLPLPDHDAAVTIGALASVRPLHSLTPDLTPVGAERDRAPQSRMMVFTEGSRSLLADWDLVARQAMLDVDGRPIRVHTDDFIRRSATTNDVEVDGDRLLMSWIDFAAVASNRATGGQTPFVMADELFAMERELSDGDERPEVEWQMLVHRVHDSRPIEFLRDAIVVSGASAQTDGRLDEFIASARRAADPFGRRWAGEGSDHEFRAWLLEQNQFGMTRALEMVVREQELWWRFPGARRDPKAIHAWLDAGGIDDIGFDPRTLEAALDVDDVEPEEANAILWRWNIVKQLLPGSQARIESKKLEHVVGRDPGIARGVAAPSRLTVEQPPSLWGSAPRPLTLVGCVRAESGLGQAARASLNALRLLGREFSHVDTSEKYPSRNSADTGLDWSTHGSLGDVNWIHSNAHEMISMAQGAFRHRFGGRFNAAMWFWETADLPDDTRPAFDVVDELWVASEYLVDVFGQYGRVPVRNIGLAADLPAMRTADRDALGFSEDEFVFLFVYDALSSYGRKNPGKALEAFTQAFAPDFDGVRFVLKVSNLNKFPASQAEIRTLEAKYPAITVIDEYLTRDGVLDLMAAADVYLSLHAAEGYGLTLLEAMALGTPTICTGYSGNMEFTNEENSWLVDYTMVKTDEQTGPYPKGSIWASPNVDSAADLMRWAATHRDEVARKAAKAREDALEAASLERYAERLDAQLRRVGV